MIENPYQSPEHTSAKRVPFIETVFQAVVRAAGSLIVFAGFVFALLSPFHPDGVFEVLLPAVPICLCGGAGCWLVGWKFVEHGIRSWPFAVGLVLLVATGTLIACDVWVRM